jgi:curved DNA-binding protein
VTLRRPGLDGEAERTNTYQVRIPPGVREGQRIRLAGQGGAGMGGGAAGDLYLRVRLARHPDFSVQGADLYCDLDLAPWEAVLGVQAKIPTLDGPTSLRVPPGTAAGSQLRLRGLGLPRADQRAAIFTPPCGFARRPRCRRKNAPCGSNWPASPTSNPGANHEQARLLR